MENGTAIRWGKGGTQGAIKHIPQSRCHRNNPVLELKRRFLEKIRKGYTLIPHETILP
ncbi:hypothetical protein LJC46_07570 [Desulfovibrio sp. OttesenSCG-928-G15]|nr:hypothetical protein [Desulfovibrio sp. OttesenSCG-928-G15]